MSACTAVLRHLYGPGVTEFSVNIGARRTAIATGVRPVIAVCCEPNPAALPVVRDRQRDILMPFARIMGG
jgi:hypothetical protein